jgi:hypothetical protein
MTLLRALSSRRALGPALIFGAVAVFAALTPPRSKMKLSAEPSRVTLAGPNDAPPAWAAATPSDVADDDALEAPPEAAINGTVLEQIDVAKYSYLRLGNPGHADIWAAVLSTGSLKGQAVMIANAEQMTSFNSASLKRTFDVIYFGVLGTPDANDDAPLAELGGRESVTASHGTEMAPHPGPGRDADTVLVRRCEKAAGPLGRSVAELHALDPSHQGSRARVRGTVVKATTGVLGRTFVHLRDATGTPPLTHDLTVTTTEELSVGALVLLEGTVKIDEDFGSGYRYQLLLADAYSIIEP